MGLFGNLFNKDGGSRAVREGYFLSWRVFT